MFIISVILIPSSIFVVSYFWNLVNMTSCGFCSFISRQVLSKYDENDNILLCVRRLGLRILWFLVQKNYIIQYAFLSTFILFSTNYNIGFQFSDLSGIFYCSSYVSLSLPNLYKWQVLMIFLISLILIISSVLLTYFLFALW